MKDIKGLKESLIYGINTSDKVIIIPHVNPDFDAIGSALGLAVIAKKYKKDVYIIVDEPSYKLYKGVSDILKDIKNEFKVISGAEYKTIKGDNDLFILTDVNGKNRIPLKDDIVENKTIVIDHHDENDDTIEGLYNYIDTSVSSASEIVTSIICTKIPAKIANYLLTGIYLDTDHLNKNFKKNTAKSVSKLMEYGADMNDVTELFLEDFYSDRRVQQLINNVQFLTYIIAYVEGDENTEYTREELARAADYLLKCKCPVNTVNASFVIGDIGDGIMSVSARSKSNVDVGEVMRQVSGGGSPTSAATQFNSAEKSEKTQKILSLIKPKYLK